MTTLPLAEVRANLSQLVESAVTTHERVEITRNGVRTAVLMSSADYDSLMETVDILSDAELVRDITEGLAQIARGELHSTEEVLAEMRAAGRATPQ